MQEGLIQNHCDLNYIYLALNKFIGKLDLFNKQVEVINPAYLPFISTATYQIQKCLSHLLPFS